MDTQDDNSKGRKTFTEEIEVAGDKLIERIKEIVEEGNVRSLRLKASDGDIVLETPLTIGVVAGGAVALAAPWLAVLGVIAALIPWNTPLLFVGGRLGPALATGNVVILKETQSAELWQAIISDQVGAYVQAYPDEQLPGADEVS